MAIQKKVLKGLLLAQDRAQRLAHRLHRCQRREVERRVDGRRQRAVGQQIAEVRRVGLDRIAVTAVGREVERRHADRRGRPDCRGAALPHSCEDVAVKIDDGDIGDPLAGRLGPIESHPHPTQLGIAAIARGQGDAVLEDVLQPLRRGVEHHQLVVEAQRVFDIELRDRAGRLADARVGDGGDLATVLVDRADRGADAAAVLQRDHVGGTAGFLPLPQVGIRRDVAEIDFLGPAEHPVAFEIDLGVAEDRAVLGGDDAVDAFDDCLDLAADGAGRDDLVGRLRAAVRGLQGRLRRGVGAVDRTVEAARDDVTVGIELHDQAAQIAVFGVGRDDQRDLAVETGRRDRVGLAGIGRRIVAVEAGEHVVAVGKTLVSTPGDPHVDAADHAGHRLRALDVVELIDLDDLVDAQGAERVDRPLDLGCGLLQVVRVDRQRIVVGGLGAVGAGLGQKFEGRRSDDADLLPVHGDDRVGRDLALDRRRFLAGEAVRHVSAQGLVGQAAQGAVGAEVEIGGDQRELRTDPGTAAGDRALQHRRTQIEFMVAQRRGVGAEGIHDGDVGPAEGRRADAGDRVHRRIGAADQPRARNEAVAFAQHQGVGVLVVEAVDQRAHDRGGLDAEQAAFTVVVKDLELEGLGHFEHRETGADLVARHEEHLSRGRVGRRNEEPAFGIEVAVVPESACIGDVGGVGDVERQREVGALQADERIVAAADGGDRHAFRLGSLVVAAGIVEQRRELGGDDALDGIAAVEHDIAVGIENREGTAAVGQDLVDVAVAVRVSAEARRIRNGEAPELGVGLQGRLVGKQRVVEVVRRIADPDGLVAGEEVVAIVALVGGHVVGLAARRIARDAVGHVQAFHGQAGQQLGQGGVGWAVAVARVHRQATEILGAQRHDGGEGRGCDVEDRDGIGLLQRHHRLGAVGRDGDVFRLDILGHGLAGPNPDALGPQRVFLPVETRESGGLHGGRRRAARQVDDRHRAVTAEVGIRHDFGLVRDEYLQAIGGKGHHVRQGTDRDRLQDVPRGGIEQHHRAGIRLDLIGDGDRHDAVLDRHARDVAAGRAQRGDRDRGSKRRRRRVAKVDDLQPGVGRHEQPLAGRVVGRNLGARKRHRANRSERQIVAGRDAHRHVFDLPRGHAGPLLVERGNRQF